MPLPAPTVERTPIHTRRIVCDGFQRADGLYEIEGWLIDTKGYLFETPWRNVPQGEPQHSLGLRIVIDKAFVIQDVVAVMDATPHMYCRSVEPNFRKLIGLKMTPGFNREVRKVLDGTLGCTHLIDLLGPMGTTAIQVVWSKSFYDVVPKDSQEAPPVVNSCRGWSAEGPLVEHVFPKFYKAPVTPPEQ